MAYIFKRCETCNNTFRANVCPSSKKEWHRFCSKKCFTDSRIGKKMSTEQREHISEGHKGIIYSAQARMNNSLSSRGDKHWNWQGGISTNKHLMRNRIEWKEWRKQIYERDDYTCQMCFSRSGKDYDGIINIEPHHRLRVADLIKYKFNKYIFDVRNGVTLCKKCHLSTL